jgi:hypothetical protein
MRLLMPVWRSLLYCLRPPHTVSLVMAVLKESSGIIGVCAVQLIRRYRIEPKHDGR